MGRQKPELLMEPPRATTEVTPPEPPNGFSLANTPWCDRARLWWQTFSGSQSPVAVCRRAALLIGLPLCLQRSGWTIGFCLRPAFTDGTSTSVRGRTDSNRHAIG